MKRKKITALITALLTAALAISGCSGKSGNLAESESEPTKESEKTVHIDDKDALLIGAQGQLESVFNPLFAESEADKMVCDLVFDQLCSVGLKGELEAGAASLTPVSEAEGKGSKNGQTGTSAAAGSSSANGSETEITDYQLTLNRGMKFSDGSDVTIDDVIFTWNLMADPYYEGIYSLAEVPVLGMEEYYYDTKDVKAYKKNLSGSYSSKQISEENFIAYLIDTKLNGWFDGKLPGDLDGKGTTWVKYLQDNGYDPTGIEENADELLKMLAKCEYEHYPFSYDPYTYYQNKSHKDLLEGGVEVPEIEGIRKTDDYTCTISFTEVNEKALRAMTVIPVLSKAYYGEGYEKGKINDLKSKNSSPIGSGAFVLEALSFGDKSENESKNESGNESENESKNGNESENKSASDGEAVLSASKNSRVQAKTPYVKVRTVSAEEKVQALKDGKISLVSLDMKDELEKSDSMQIVPVKGNGFVYFGINTDVVNSKNIRKGVMDLIDKDLLNAGKEKTDQILTAGKAAAKETGKVSEQGKALNQAKVSEQGKVSDQVVPEAQTWPMTRFSEYYPGIDQLLKGGSSEAESSEDVSSKAVSEDKVSEDGVSGDSVSEKEEDPWKYSKDNARSNFGEAGYLNDGVNGLVHEGEQLKLNMGISEELPDCIKAIAYQLKADLKELGAKVTLKEYSESDMQEIIPTAALDMWIGTITDLTDYDMEEYLKYGGKKNYFHCNNEYGDLIFKEIKETKDNAYRRDLIKEMLGYVKEGAYCRPLCTEISRVYAADSSVLEWAADKNLNEYDNFCEIICGIKVKK
ncbi:MAG: ABC transporter substrate-binding protein [Lachnospiraceae bacterium]|nr:ABC transporter substrate-binding protein [Lachnospiraceae bacterium]